MNWINRDKAIQTKLALVFWIFGIIALNSSGALAQDLDTLHYWPMQKGIALADTDLGHAVVPWEVKGVGDVDGDGYHDIVWQNATSGQVHYWKMVNGVRVDGKDIFLPVGGQFALRGVGDVDGDGHHDIIWQHSDGQVLYWKMVDGIRVESVDIFTPVGGQFALIGVGDVDGNGHHDIIWQHSGGQVLYWKMVDGSGVESVDISTPVGGQFALRGVGDLDGDGHHDIIWQHADGQVLYWRMVGGSRVESINIPTSKESQIAGFGDLNGDGTDDIVWRRPPNCQGYFCDKTFNSIVIAMTHNTFATPGKVFSPNQHRGIVRQFQDGIRGFNPDLYTAGNNILWTSHGGDWGYDPSSEISALVSELNKPENRYEFIVVQVQDAMNVPTEDKFLRLWGDLLIKNFNSNEKLSKYIERNKRVLVLTGGTANPDKGVHDTKKLIIENEYEWSVCYGYSYPSQKQRYQKEIENLEVDPGAAVLMNYFCSFVGGTGDPVASAHVNNKDRILSNVETIKGLDYTGGKVNIIQVDYYEKGDVFEALAALGYRPHQIPLNSDPRKYSRIGKEKGLSESCPSGMENKGLFCYSRHRGRCDLISCWSCPAGYTDRGLDCLNKNGSGWPHKWSHKSINRVTRTIKPVSLGCRAGYEQEGLLCYPKCEAEYTGSGLNCRSPCPQGYAATGSECKLRSGF